MKAVFITRYGGPEVLELRDTPDPSPSPGQVLVRVHATAVNPIDWKIRNGEMKAIIRKPLPFIIGCELTGVVEAAPPGARLAVGDEVMGGMPGNIGANAELVAVDENALAKKPKNTSFEEAVSLPVSAGTAVTALREVAKVKPGQRVLVNGASGGVGTFGVQVAKALGAHVTGVCSTANIDLVKSLGADDVIDYKTTDVLQTAKGFDVVFNLVAEHDFPAWRGALAPKGIYVTASPKNWGAAFARQALLTPFTSKKAYVILVKPSSALLASITELVEQGKLRPVVDRVMPLAEVAEAHKYSETGRAKGKIVLTV